jgi:hypothetical protein
MITIPLKKFKILVAIKERNDLYSATDVQKPRRGTTCNTLLIFYLKKKMFPHCCSLSLWRVVRGSKLMHLDHLIHGLFIT